VSVLSAIEGLKDAPGLNGRLDPFVLPIAAGILIGPVHDPVARHRQRGAFFGPITAVWFLTLAGLGLFHIFDDISILRACRRTTACCS
jgi:KUP system potassium uptake protein